MDMVYFEEALDFLIDHPKIQAEKGIGVCGISKGAEFGLAMAASIPSSKIGAIAAINGTVYSCMVPIYYKNKLVCEGNSATFLGLEGKEGLLKFMFFKEATKVGKIFLLSNDRNISSVFVASLENMKN